MILKRYLRVQFQLKDLGMDCNCYCQLIVETFIWKLKSGDFEHMSLETWLWNQIWTQAGILKKGRLQFVDFEVDLILKTRT